ncbi:MAG: sigma factor-like helix-turn-helix DNA-binding protein [Patescibacteria group bacterium]
MDSYPYSLNMLNEQEKNNFTDSISKILKSLNPRTQDVISRRFGLKAGGVETLESIGKKYKITRERVRQIEEAALRELRKNFDSFELNNRVSEIKNIFQQYGSIIRQDFLFYEFSGSSRYNKTNGTLVLLMTISSNFENYPENEDYYEIWTLKDPSYISRAKEIVSKVMTSFKRQGSVVPEAELVPFFGKASQESTGDKKIILSYLSLSKRIGKNIFGETGLADWPEIRPKGIKDKAFLVLKRTGKPLHFREIADTINSYKFDSKRANFQTVHNELIKDKRFVLVGRGLYALSEWGYEAGTVKEVLAKLLKENGPMAKDKIIAKTTEVRFVKPNTIVLNLQDKNLFKKDKEGFYCLVEN